MGAAETINDDLVDNERRRKNMDGVSDPRAIVSLFGIDFAVMNLEQAAEAIVLAAEKGTKGLVVTPNADHVVRYSRSQRFRSVVDGALMRFADGMPIVWVSRLLKVPLPERVTGADLLPAIVSLTATRGARTFFLGGHSGVAEKAKGVLCERFKGAQVVGVYSPPFGFEKDQMETRKIIEMINALDVHILFFGVGSPKQEYWAHEHLSELKVGPIVCVGAAFDFAAGEIKRAPLWLQNIGGEWLWRLGQEPKRLWKRYILIDTKFIILTLREIIRRFK